MLHILLKNKMKQKTVKQTPLNIYIRRMKIGFDAKRIFNNTTGLGNYSRSLVRNLHEYFPENQYHLFSPEVKRAEHTKPFLATPYYKVHISKTRLKSYWRSFSIVKDLSIAGIELFHGLSNEIPHNLGREGIKCVVTIHDLIFKIYPETYSISERLIYDRKFRYACQNADKVIAISESTKNDIIRFYDIDPAKIEVIYQTCNPIFYNPRTQEENLHVAGLYNLPDEYFLYVGSVEKRKNLELIIETYKINKDLHRVPLIIIGKGGDYKAECKRLISRYGLESSFIWMDNFKNNEHLQSVYHLAKALIYPSLYEGFGLPIAEALLCKTPVITAKTSSLKEAGGPDSIYINPFQPMELAEAMMTILKGESIINSMCENGYHYAMETFDKKLLTEKIMTVYKKVINQ